MKTEQINISLDAIEQLKNEIQKEVEYKFYTKCLAIQEEKIKAQNLEQLLDFFKADGKPLGKTAINIKTKAIKAYIEALNKEVALLRGYAGLPSEEQLKEYKEQENKPRPELEFDWFN